ncbi:hypothetical protein Vretimale_19238 [Volvox reticuliferus]|uniref:MD-2-related lipid-recognition domain-containing protein n=1 Tax=Volvox reticuliferus TaxID=1737510 RepID=A0A8J4FK62_9CHLO|nr:hypothetical protein Vretifemale_7846 [Volvox reticuliferus]GIM16641.1 hypothetical protein Vretimale_19238 [Volvox reticuliferus]
MCSAKVFQATLLAVLAASFQYVAADKMTWAPCDEGLTAFTPSSVTLSPDPPVIGSAATFVITGNIDKELQGGSVDMVVSFSGFPIFSSSSDLCTKTACPVPAGPISLTLEELLPPIAPPGDYGLQVVARGPDGAELACVNVNFSLVLPGHRTNVASALKMKLFDLLKTARGAGEVQQQVLDRSNMYMTNRRRRTTEGIHMSP